MSDPRYVRTGDIRPTRPQAQAVWAWLSTLRRLRPDNATILGAYEAAEWVHGLTDVPPVTDTLDDRDPDPGRIARETLAALETRLGAREGDADRAGGAYAFLAWWNAVDDLPEWLVPQLDRLADAG